MRWDEWPTWENLPTPLLVFYLLIFAAAVFANAGCHPVPQPQPPKPPAVAPPPPCQVQDIGMQPGSCNTGSDSNGYVCAKCLYASGCEDPSLTYCVDGDCKDPQCSPDNSPILKSKRPKR